MIYVVFNFLPYHVPVYAGSSYEDAVKIAMGLDSPKIQRWQDGKIIDTIG
jgi:hypothetical protein